MDAPTHMRRQNRRGWNENALTLSISKTPILQRGWYQRRINCITRVRFWRSFRHGLEVFERFGGKKDGTVWYYRTLVTAFRQHGDHSDLIDELDRVVSEIEKFVRKH